jgi:hypothetical protein
LKPQAFVAVQKVHPTSKDAKIHKANFYALDGFYDVKTLLGAFTTLGPVVSPRSHHASSFQFGAVVNFPVLFAQSSLLNISPEAFVRRRELSTSLFVPASHNTLTEKKVK